MSLFDKIRNFLINRSLVFKLSASVLLSVVAGSLLLSLFVSNYSKPILKEQVISSAFNALGELNANITQGAAIVEQSIVNTANILNTNARPSDKELSDLTLAALRSIEQQYGYFYEFWIYIPSKTQEESATMYYSCFKNGKEKILRPLWTRNGYLKFSLCLDGKHHNFSAHVLVAKAFISNPDNLPEINHIDGEKFNCHVSNLEFSTRSKNNKHAFKNGLKKQKKGGDNPKAKLTNEEAAFCRKVYKPHDKEFGLKALAERFGVNVRNMYNIITGKSYTDA